MTTTALQSFLDTHQSLTFDDLGVLKTLADDLLDDVCENVHKEAIQIDSKDFIP